MTQSRLDGLSLLIVGSLLFIVMGTSFEYSSFVSMVDFKAVFYPARCLLEHKDPYNSSDLRHVYLAEDGEPQASKLALVNIVVPNVNLPTALPFIVPFALLPWGPAHLIWILLTAGSFILAAYLMWELGAAYAPRISGGLLFLFLIGSEILIEVGNTAGIVVSLCVISAWCFLQKRFTMAGVLCLASSLLVKPQDAGFVWLYFLLAGGICRKRALQTLLLASVLGLLAVLWVSYTAPNWLQELHSNISATSARGGINDPASAGARPQAHGATMVNLQTALSVFRDDRRIYNLATYVLCAPSVFLWVYTTLRKRFFPANAYFALAAIAALSMLLVYHRAHDTRLLLLTVPACAMLWAEGGLTAWLALVLTALGTVFTSNISLEILATITMGLRASIGGLPGEILTVLLCRPAPLILLIMSTFYLWVYVRHSSARSSGPCSCQHEKAEG
jgi:hypothetical protein